jgi:hypothetical protein
MFAAWAFYKPSDDALWFDCHTFDCRSTYWADVYSGKFVVRRFAHVTGWIPKIDLFANESSVGTHRMAT